MENRNTSSAQSSNRIIAYGLTFDDVLLLPAYSEVLPHTVSLQTQLSRHISLNIPIVSAAMDTVTESSLAISLAREGGIGILHKNMSIKRQAEEVRRVKRSESGLITDPITLHATATMGEALKLMHENKIGGIPIVDNQKKLCGILTNRDLRFEQNYTRPISEMMTQENLITAPEGTTLVQAEAILKKHKIEKLPVVRKDGTLAGLITYKDIIRLSKNPLSCKDALGRLRVGAAVGVGKETFERVQALLDVGVDVVCVDTAHGHSKGVIDTVREIKNTFSGIELIAGNIATAAAAQALVDAGADAVKVGVGPGSICTTRIIAGVGVPQLSAVMNVAEALQNTDVPVIADGGIRYSGDIVKALAAGASSIMAGSLFAGVEESPGEVIIYEGRKFKTYRGMGSIEAMAEGSKDRYFQETQSDSKKLVPEGVVGRLPYKGYLSEVVLQYIGGIRAAMGYCGAPTVKDLRRNEFVQISTAGIRESHVHDVVITNEAPNYYR
ncbi:MAG: IMP dehydrogenase [Chitinophagales bacterium]|nr:IMP dehydrogenase [Bacteroidota bacterium]MCB9043422.1 IMP dehydrogenase [Chitinophagales bacterium]